MSTAYPGAIDTLTNPTGTDTLNSPSHSAQHANANDAIEAIETELGTDPAGAWTNVAERLNVSCIVAQFGASGQSISSSFTPTTLAFDTVEDEDDETASFSLNTSTGIITVAHAGWYEVKAGVALSTNATGMRRISIDKNGTEVAIAMCAPGTTGVLGTITTSRLIKLAANDTISAKAAQSSGSALNTSADEQTFLSIHRVR